MRILGILIGRLLLSILRLPYHFQIYADRIEERGNPRLHSLSGTITIDVRAFEEALERLRDRLQESEEREDIEIDTDVTWEPLVALRPGTILNYQGIDYELQEDGHYIRRER